MEFLGFQKSKTNPKATARSGLRRSICDALICGFFVLIVLVVKGALLENWGYVIVLSLIHI